MTRKHYIAIAAAIRDVTEEGLGTYALAVDLARIFKGDNPNFDQQKFIDACGGRP